MGTSSPIVPKLSTEILLIPAILELYHKPPLNTIVIKMARWRLLFEKTISAILLDFSMVNFYLGPITLR